MESSKNVYLQEKFADYAGATASVGREQTVAASRVVFVVIAPLHVGYKLRAGGPRGRGRSLCRSVVEVATPAARRLQQGLV
jgi:hypothetical protein